MQAKTTAGWIFGRRRADARLVVAALLFGLAIGVAACGGTPDATEKPPDYKQLKGAPPALAELYANGDAVLAGDTTDVQKRLDRLHGYPVVVNAWASWCGPCREEFPLFQQASASLGTKVGFLGLDTNDVEDAAKTFLEERPLPYPSYIDAGWDLSDEFTPGVHGLPKTAFYDSSGERVFVHQGPYTSVDQLEADIKRYAE
jgi:cytochrome c biogenesis protein CcmG/thiol:disulfide interchange protein DsbE